MARNTTQYKVDKKGNIYLTLTSKGETRQQYLERYGEHLARGVERLLGKLKKEPTTNGVT